MADGKMLLGNAPDVLDSNRKIDHISTVSKDSTVTMPGSRTISSRSNIPPDNIPSDNIPLDDISSKTCVIQKN